MKKPLVLASILAALAAPAFAGPLDGIEQNTTGNGGLSIITGGDGATYAVNEGRDVYLSYDTIGATNGKAGLKANENSVVGPFVTGGCKNSTRVDLPGSDGGC